MRSGNRKVCESRTSPEAHHSVFTKTFTRYLPAAQIIWTAGLLIWWLAHVMSAPFDPDYASGEIYDHILHWLNHEQLYAPLSSGAPFRVLVYPPGFLALVRGIATLGGDALLWGRLLHLCSVIAAVVIIFNWLRREGVTQLHAGALVAFLLAGNYPTIYFVGQLHIQWPAILFTLLAADLLSRPAIDRSRGMWLAIAAGAAAALACFMKHSQVVPGFVFVLFLLASDRRRLLPFLLGGFLIAMPGVVILQIVFGNELWRQVVTYSVGWYSWEQLGDGLQNVAVWTAAAIAGIMLALRSTEPAKLNADVRFWYFAGASVWIFSSARSGAGPQYFTEWCCATVIWIGPAISAFLSRTNLQGRTVRALALAIAAQVLIADAITLVRLCGDVSFIRNTEAALEQVCASMPSGEKLVPIEYVGIARACGRQALLQPFIMTMLSRTGMWDDSVISREFGEGKYEVILLPFLSEGEEINHDRWSDNMLAGIARGYQVETRLGDWTVMRPKKQ